MYDQVNNQKDKDAIKTMQKEFNIIEPEYSIKSPSSIVSSVDSQNYARGGFPLLQTYDSHHSIESFSDQFNKQKTLSFSSAKESMQKILKKQLITQIKDYE